MDPVRNADAERNAALGERDDARNAWEEMGAKHERAMETNLELRAELNKASKNLPWLEQRNFELAEENSVQHNEIEHLKIFKEQHDELLQQISVYGMSAKRPEYYQQRSENVQRQLEISNNLLEKSRKSVEALEEELGTQRENANQERVWLQAQLKKNARSPAYWAKHRPYGGALESKSTWGVRCACTEPEIAYGLRDQGPRIIELEATVTARDLTIRHLRESRHTGSLRKNGAASTSKVAKTSPPSTEDSKPITITGSQTTTATHLHACEYEQQCKNIGKQVADDAKTIEGLRKECQDLRDAASNKNTTDAVEISTKAEFEGELAAKNKVIKELQEENAMKSEELATSKKTFDDLREEMVTARKELATSNQLIKGLRDEKATAGEELAAKNEEINRLQVEKTTANRDTATEISNLDQKLSDSRKDLVDAREVHAECERNLGQQKTKIYELETAQRGLEDTIKDKDREIEDLEKANQEIAEQSVPESAENLQRLTTANSNLNELRREYAECKGHSEIQTARIGELEAAGQVKDDRIANLENQINNGPSNDVIERQNQSHNAAVSKKDEDYRALYDLYKKMLGQQGLAEAQHNEDMQSLNTMQQSGTATQLELQRVWAEYNNHRLLHTNCEERSLDLTNQLRQGANTYTDLQTKFNTQATELDGANQNVSGLRSQISNLQQAIANLEQMNSSSESNFEKYRVEGENRARPIWQANVDREMSAQASKLEASELEVFKLNSQLQQAKKQLNPLREMQIKAREDAVKVKEDALKLDTDAMDHDQQGSKTEQEIKILETKLVAANKDAGDARVRNRGIQSQLNKERKERADEKEKASKALKKEQEDSERRAEILKLRLEKDNPLKSTVSSLQNEVARLSKELGESKARENDGQ